MVVTMTLSWGSTIKLAGLINDTIRSDSFNLVLPWKTATQVAPNLYCQYLLDTADSVTGTYSASSNSYGWTTDDVGNPIPFKNGYDFGYATISKKVSDPQYYPLQDLASPLVKGPIGSISCSSLTEYFQAYGGNWVSTGFGNGYTNNSVGVGRYGQYTRSNPQVAYSNYEIDTGVIFTATGSLGQSPYALRPACVIEDHPYPTLQDLTTNNPYTLQGNCQASITLTRPYPFNPTGLDSDYSAASFYPPSFYFGYGGVGDFTSNGSTNTASNGGCTVTANGRDGTLTYVSTFRITISY